MLTKASVELIQAVQQSPKDFFSGEQLTLEFEGGKVLHLRFSGGFCYIGIAGCCTGEACMKRGEEISVGPMGLDILERPLIELKRAFGAIIMHYLGAARESLHSRRPDPPAAPANPPFLWYKPFLNLSYSVRTRKHFYTAVKIGFASKEGLATDVLSLLSRLMMIFKFPKLIGRARNGTRTLTARSEKNEFIFVDTLVFSMRKAYWPTDIRERFLAEPS